MNVNECSVEWRFCRVINTFLQQVDVLFLSTVDFCSLISLAWSFVGIGVCYVLFEFGFKALTLGAESLSKGSSSLVHDEADAVCNLKFCVSLCRLLVIEELGGESLTKNDGKLFGDGGRVSRTESLQTLEYEVAKEIVLHLGLLNVVLDGEHLQPILGDF